MFYSIVSIEGGETDGRDEIRQMPRRAYSAIKNIAEIRIASEKSS
jgi:hypothetical protein